MNLSRNAVLSMMLGCCLTLLAGCQSAPAKNYHLLQGPAPTAWQEGAPITRTLGIGPIELPEYLNRSQVAVQRGDGSIALDVTELWAEPLAAGVGRVLALHLTGGRADTRAVLFPWRSDDQPAVSLRLKVAGLEHRDGQLRLSATWELRKQPDNQWLQAAHFSQQVPAGTDPDSIRRALDSLLAKLAEAVAAALDKT